MELMARRREVDGAKNGKGNKSLKGQNERRQRRWI
jgi:hypothetical protein